MKLRKMVLAILMCSSASAAQAACYMPLPAPEDLAVAVPAYRGRDASTVALGSQDTPTYAATIEIEPGERPLFLMLQSRAGPTIWTFTGALWRISQVVLAGDAAVGVDANRVYFLKAADCRSKDLASGAGAAMKDVFRANAGRDPDAVFEPRTPSYFRLPSGEGLKEGSVANPPVVQVDQTGVVSNSGAADYVLMPQGEGIRQLEEAGYLVRKKDGYRIVAPFPRFPAGLFGGHRVEFSLAPGVPLPAGSLGHSCVIVEETGAKIGTACP